jgi:amino acid transporter
MIAAPKQELSLFDSTCLIVGIIIGAGIYQMAPDIAKGTTTGFGVLGLWLLGATLSLCGALCYAELASTYPREGGDYVYLTKAYGDWAGFLFGWAQMVVVRPGDIAVMAFAFATYARQIYSPLKNPELAQEVYAAAATIAFTGINILGVRQGKWTQNLLTTVKALGLLLIVGAAFFAKPTLGPIGSQGASLPLSLALIFVLFTYGGWNEMAYVAAEVKDSKRNITRALVLGIAAVAVLYLLVNTAFLYALGHDGLKNSKAVGTEVVAAALPGMGAVLVSVLICISALGAVNGLIFTGARITYALGSDHRLFRHLGRWHPRFGTPAAALMLQGAIAVALIVLLGSFVEAVLYTAATVYSFYLASTLALIVLRRREPDVPRPYKVWGYPFTPIIFAATCLFLIQSAVTYKPMIAKAAIGLLLLGLIVYVFSKRIGSDKTRSLNPGR